MRTTFWLESLKGRNHSKDLGMGERIILKFIIEKLCLGMLIALIWLKIGTGVGGQL
jgi:hypothetical protein